MDITAEDLVNLCKKRRRVAEIGSSDYRHLLSQVMACSAEELQRVCANHLSARGLPPLTVMQVAALESLRRDVHIVYGLFAIQLKDALEDTTTR